MPARNLSYSESRALKGPARLDDLLAAATAASLAVPAAGACQRRRRENAPHEQARLAPDRAADASEQFNAAEDDYRTALDLLGDPPADGELYYALLVNRGYIRIERQDPSAAADFQAAIRQNSHRFEAFSGLAHALQQQGKTDLALEQLAKAIELQPRFAQLHRARADLILGLANFAPDLRDVDLRQLEVNIRKIPPERLEVAASDLEDAIRFESPETPWIVAYNKTKQAVLFHVAGQSDRALKACEAALLISPRLAFTHQLRINVLLQLNQYDDLIRSCDLALTKVKESAELYELRGMVRDHLEQYAAAVADYTLALKNKPENAGVLHRRGWSYLAADDAARFARLDFDKAIGLEPANADGYSGRGLALATLPNTRLPSPMPTNR